MAEERRVPGAYTTLEQGWDHTTRERFWFTPQGTSVMPYRWFLALEVPGGAQRVASEANMEQLGFIPAPKSAYNPDGLAIGLTRDHADGQDKLGVTCAACHTARLTLGGTHVLVDGAPATADVNRFFRQLAQSLGETAKSDVKFARFAGELLGGDAGDAARSNLRAQLGEAAQKAQRLQSAVMAAQTRKGHLFREIESGPGRVDAFGNIINSVAIRLDPRNAALASAPVSFSQLWDAPLADAVQWNGALLNAPVLGALSRNIGEVLGVFGGLDFGGPERDPKAGYDNSVNLESLGKLENWLTQLTSPAWPNEHLPPIDRARAAAGAQVYTRECQGCHVRIEARDPARSFKSKMVAVDSVGTDPTLAVNLLLRRARTGPIAGRRSMLVKGEPLPAETRAFDTVINAIAGVMLRDPETTLRVGFANRAQGERMRGQTPTPAPSVTDRSQATAVLAQLFEQEALFGSDGTAYRARPLNGIWATAPYLHNGSVPSLADLLTPSAQRPRKFFVGSREFDPDRVGLRSDAASGGAVLDCDVPGNDNRGHEYGTSLPAGEKAALLEFLKTL